MVLVTFIDVLRQISLDAFHLLAVLRVSLRHLELVNESVVNLAQFLVLVHQFQVFLCSPLLCRLIGIAFLQLQVNLMEGNKLAQFVVVVCVHHIWVEPEHVAVGNAVGNSILVESVAKQRLCGNLVLGILLKHGSSGKTKQQGTRKGMLDTDKHIAKHTTMTLIDDEHKSLLTYLVYQFAGYCAASCCWGTLLYVAHLLYGGDDKAVVAIRALQFVEQYRCVCRVLYLVSLACKSSVFVERLKGKFYTVKQEHYFVGITTHGNKLRTLER